MSRGPLPPRVKKQFLVSIFFLVLVENVRLFISWIMFNSRQQLIHTDAMKATTLVVSLRTSMVGVFHQLSLEQRVSCTRTELNKALGMSIWSQLLAFPVNDAKEVIHKLLNEALNDKQYQTDKVEQWTTTLSQKIKDALKVYSNNKYKIVSQVILGAQKGSGGKVACKCIWDSANDTVATANFNNDTIFCVGAAFAIYQY